MKNKEQHRFKVSNKKTLAEAYAIPPRTLKLWLQPIEKEVGAYLGKSFSPKQVATIVKLLGEPENLQLITLH